MITVREAVHLLRGAEYIGLAYGGTLREIDAYDQLDLDAYGSCLVSRICQGHGEKRYELEIAVRPLRKLSMPVRRRTK